MRAYITQYIMWLTFSSVYVCMQYLYEKYEAKTY